ncbi:membrane protein [Primorskyibacter flagellatus]|uniref:Membrane protein n=1 Tax=Primorskyibacter flagellatus TaxID=1387277 RepID=A0A917EE22_9RHOB|nr:outer membrane protein transport protein [Primorskyibacter flagellatus]GGE26839.1 membrane protein [Primorskyibacter flagellatus]
MNKTFWPAATAATICLAGAAQAGGIERTTQSSAILFAQGNRVELSYAVVTPSISGTAITAIPNVADRYGLPGLAMKMDINEQLSFALIYDRPFGADVVYDAANPMFGGTLAKAETHALTALARYKFDDRISVFGGLRAQRAEGQIHLQGAAYGAASGYDAQLASDWGVGYVVGAAYEIPDIALRVALTYNSAIKHDFDTRENIAPGVVSTTEVKTPQSINLDFQTGIAKDTLLMASIRWAEHSAFRIKPTAINTDLVSLDDTTTYSLGVARRFTPEFAASLTVGYEKEGDPLVSPLAPTNGRKSITLGASYKLSDTVELSGGISKIWVGDAQPATGGVGRGLFTDNSVTAVGLKIAYTF